MKNPVQAMQLAIVEQVNKLFVNPGLHMIVISSKVKLISVNTVRINTYVLIDYFLHGRIFYYIYIHLFS